MLTPLDEYPIHQITDTFATVATSDQHWNDGHYVCLCDMDGNVGLVSTVRLYHNNDVLDGFVCIRHEGRQYNIRVSRRLRPDVHVFGAGPLRVELLEPLKSLRLVLEANDYGIECDVVCETGGLPWMGPVSVTKAAGVMVSERLTYEIAGRVTGHVTVAGKRFDLRPDNAHFFRNHSWGYMPGRGGPRSHSAPLHSGGGGRQGIRNWVLWQHADHSGFFEFMEDGEGRRTSTAYTLPTGEPYPPLGAILLEDRRIPITGVDHDLEFYDGSDRLKAGRISVHDADGGTRAFALEDLGWLYCQGGGYFGGFNDGLGQGVYRGDYHEEGEAWDVSHPTRILQDGEEKKFGLPWAESFVRFTADDGSRGLAHYESVVMGRYPRYGFGT
jgi:hypothetical protein